MALSPEDIRKRYPLPAYNYRVTVLAGTDGRDEVEKGAYSISFASVSGLTASYDKVEYRHGFSFREGPTILAGIQQTYEIRLAKGLVKNGSFLYNWIHHGSEKGVFLPVKRDILIDLCDEEGLPVIRWKVFGALPLKLNAPEFDAKSSEAAIESLELTARKMVVEYNP